jgi:multidrug efflux system membrane fusion protein
VTAYDQDNRNALSKGTLLLVDNAVDQASGTIRLKAMFANDEDELWPGESVNARLLLETRNSVLAVPPTAIQRGPQGLVAWVITPSNTAEPRTIEVGPATGNLVIVTSGLNDGERVVTDGHYKLARNAPVTVTSPASLASGGAK